jgi:hypothetical protein|tara:strand:+ start:3180 stop:3296 length:117 start_codon:yes stop_codon:yes gene_type:complete
MKFINWIKAKIWAWKKNREYKKRIAELKKRDPFTYKNF